MTSLSTTNRRPAIWRATFLLGFLLLGLPGCAKADKVTDWNAIGSTAIANAGRGGTPGAIDLAYMHIAIYDAVNAIDRRYTVFAVSPSSVPPGASEEAATVEAAYRILINLFATQAAFLDAQYTTSLATIPDGAGKVNGMAVGAEVAALFLASRAGDGRNAPVTYTPGSGPGAWVPTSNAPPATPWLAQMRPFAIESPSQFRPDPPPALNSEQWAADYNEVKRLGALNSAERTPEQTTIARFYIDPGVVQAGRGFRKLALDRSLSLAVDARLFAVLYVTLADSIIAGFEAKYHYGFWRPLTAIRAGDTDGNPDTEADPTWLPLDTTPNHPEYPAAHTFADAAWAEALRHFFGTKKIEFTLSSTTTGTEITFDNTNDIIKSVIEARIYAGFHYRNSCVQGTIIGKKVAKWVARHYFLRADN
ncbi:MAG TPA: vanadium-dependent haloperoxidase [Pyrinomonadaceae bacterium]|nr:vanadium-dependent haloperoxidase [Pyrinomonadaceae bacterium]